MAKTIAAVTGIIILVAALFVLEVNMIVWNATDIVDNGLNFWNAFWLSLVAITWFGAGKATK